MHIYTFYFLFSQYSLAILEDNKDYYTSILQQHLLAIIVLIVLESILNLIQV